MLAESTVRRWNKGERRGRDSSAQLNDPPRTASDTERILRVQRLLYTERMGLANTERAGYVYTQEREHSQLRANGMAQKKRGPLKVTDAEQDHLGGIFSRS